jgi:hypothetical protein
MDRIKKSWWIGAAGLISALQLVAGIETIFDASEGTGRFLFVALAITGAALVAGGIVTRRTNRSFGSILIGVGVLPSTSAIILFWFPPALFYGALAIAVAVVAFIDATAQRRLVEA